MKKKGGKKHSLEATRSEHPELVRRRANRKSTIVSGRTIGEKRERLETANERAAARKKDKKKATRRLLFTILGFAILGGILVLLGAYFIHSDDPTPISEVIEPEPEYQPTVEIIDEDAGSGSKITGRMQNYIGQAEYDFRQLSYNPVKVIVPSGSIREVDFYLADHPGYIKLTIDRDTAVSVEDADRLIRYLAEQGITEYEYLDVRLPGRAFWK